MKKRWTKGDLCNAVEKSKSIRQVLSCLKLKEAGGNYFQIKKYLNLYKIDYSHFTGQAWNKGMKGIGKPRILLKDILVKNSNYQSYKLKKRLFTEGLKSRKCEECGWAKTSKDNRVPLELDHINGDVHDNRLENLRILCPNCHSLKLTHRGCNRGKQGPVAERNTHNT
ncbi:MAG: HNH endonuclease signature motif containing protein [Candidatus Nealsonbacteria bacterium]